MIKLNFRTTTLLFLVVVLALVLIKAFACPCNFALIGLLCSHQLLFFLLLVFIYLMIVVLFSFKAGSQFHYSPVICRGDGGQRWVSLSFDDGPDAEYTPVILDILKKNQVTATFFLIGNKINGNEELVKRMFREGHTLANHSFSHTNFWDLWSPARLHHDMVKTEELIFGITGQRTLYFRPPYGVINPRVSKALRMTPYSVIAWSRWSMDTAATDPQKLLKRITGNLQPGDIILMHDTQKITAGILDEAIQAIHNTDLRIVSMAQLTNLPAYV